MSRYVSVVGITLSLVACGEANAPGKLQLVIPDWSGIEGAELAAYGKIAALHEASHENVEIFWDKEANKGVYTANLEESMLSPEHPEMFHVNAGADVNRWMFVETNGRYDLSDPSAARCMIRDLGPLLRETALDENIRPDLRAALCPGGQCDTGARYALPLNVHRLNMAYWNAARLRAFEDAHAGRAPERADFCADDGSPGPLAGSDLTIAIDLDRGSFALSLFTFENVLPAMLGWPAYEAFFSGELEHGGAWRADFAPVLRCVQSLSRSFMDRAWRRAFDDVEEGTAMLTVMGDWASGEFEKRGSIGRGVVVATPFPGTEGVFVFTSDAFALPVRSPHPGEIRELLRTMAQPEVQREFTRIKGGIPARLDVDLGTGASCSEPAAPPDDVDPYVALAQRTRADYCDDARVQKVLATSGLVPYYYPTNGLRAALVDMVRAARSPADPDQSVERVLDELDIALATIKRWKSSLENRSYACPE